MSIRFFCTCGKHLKAREEMAGRRSLCPACGQPVGIPSLEPTQRGTAAAPLTQAERRSRKASHAPALAAQSAIARFPDIPGPSSDPPESETVADVRTAAKDPAYLRPVQSAKERRKSQVARVWPLERRWHHCLLYPFRVWPLVMGLGLLLAVFLGVAAFDRSDGIPPDHRWLAWLGWLGLASISAASCGFLQCVLASGAAGDASRFRWPAADVLMICRSLISWLACFLAGPVVFAAAAFWLWLHGGDLAVVDWIILAELAMAGGSYWLLTLIAVSQRERLTDANPARVADVIRLLGPIPVAATFLAGLAALVLVHGIAIGLEEMRHGILGGLLLVATTTCGMYGATFFFRLLGLWCRRSRVEIG